MFKFVTHFKSGFNNFTIIIQDEISVAFITGCFIIVHNKSKILLLHQQSSWSSNCMLCHYRIKRYYTNVIFRAFAFTNYLKRRSMSNILLHIGWLC